MTYERINWKNKPDTATPINAENLNKMDKGIKDIEEGKIGKTDLVQTDQVNNPEKVPSSTVTHALGQEIDTLNNNLDGVLVMRGRIPESGEITIKCDTIPFSFMLFVQGNGGAAYGAYVLQGYGPGQSTRNHVGEIQSGSQMDVIIDNQSFVVSNSHSIHAEYALLIMIGRSPDIT